jgi:hypothetical protein
VKHLPTRPEGYAIVRSRDAAGVRDIDIAEEIKRSQSQVHRARKRLGIAPCFGPGRPATEDTTR